MTGTGPAPGGGVAPLAASEIGVCDCTLREGEQTAGVALSLGAKVEILGALEDCGIKQIQVGYPGVSKADYETVRELVRHRTSAAIETISIIHVDDWRSHITAAVEVGADIVSMQFGVSDVRLDRVLDMSRDDVYRRIEEAVEFATGLGATVSFTPTDVARADPDFAISIFRLVESCGASRVRCADSVGVANPTSWRAFIELVKGAIAIPVGAHVHNDYGLAMANVWASIEAGCEWIDGVVNGIGERSGNSALEEVIMVLEDHLHVDTGVDLAKLTQLSRTVSRLTKIPVPRGKAIVGPDAFAHQLDQHIRGVVRDPSVYEPFPPDRVGNQRRFPLGRLSGPYAVALKLRELGIDVGTVDTDAILNWVRLTAVREGGEVGEQSFREYATSTLAS